MHCPFCGGIEVLYGRQPWLHAVRSIANSHKRYCPNCDKKWRVRPRIKRFPWLIMGIVVLSGIFAMLFLRGADSALLSVLRAPKNDTLPLLNKELVAKAQRRLKEDPGAFSKLSPEKQKKATEMMKKMGISLPS